LEFLSSKHCWNLKVPLQQTRESIISSGKSKIDVAKLCATTVAELLKQLILEGNKMGHSNASNVKDVVPILKKDDLNESMAWSDAI